MAQRVVIDANVTLGLVLSLPYSLQVDRQMQIWRSDETRIIVPTLWEYECLTGLRRAAATRLISASNAWQIAKVLFSLGFERVPPNLELHESALQWADRLSQSKAYDAQYLALAESRLAEFWTADKRLFHTLQGLDVQWAHAIQVV
jgi:predicted nucleic acid-binding protein